MHRPDQLHVGSPSPPTSRIYHSYLAHKSPCSPDFQIVNSPTAHRSPSPTTISPEALESDRTSSPVPYRRTYSHSHPLTAILGGRVDASTSALSSPGDVLHSSIQYTSTNAGTRGSLLPITPPGDHPELQKKSSFWLLHFEWQKARAHLRRLCFWGLVVAVFASAFGLTYVIPSDLQSQAPVVVGSLLSLLSSCFILVSFTCAKTHRRFPNEILVYVALCELGLAILSIVHVAMYCSSGESVTRRTCAMQSITTCSVLSGVRLFLLCGSVGWFASAIFQLFVAVSNPFADHKSQLKLYHLVVWTASTIMAVAIPLILFSNGFQRQYDMTSEEICSTASLLFPLLPRVESKRDLEWRVSQWKSLVLLYWGAFLGLVVLLVIAAQFTLIISWWRSNSGTVIALKARRRMMKRMTVYVHSLNATWLFILASFFVYWSNDTALQQLPSSYGRMSIHTPNTSTTRNTGAPHVLVALFQYLLSAKGFCLGVVWILVNRWGFACLRSHRDTSEEESNGQHTNPATYSDSSPHDLFSSPEFERQHRLGRALQSVGSASSLLSSRSSKTSTQSTETLQQEIIYYTVSGITKAILHASQSHDTHQFFQQLLVGAERDPTFANVTFFSHVQSVDMVNSPRAFCAPTSRMQTVPDHLMSGGSTSPPRRSSTQCQSYGQNQLSSTFLRASAYFTRLSQEHVSSRSSIGRFSLYPVSHVPFELFEQEIELQSNQSPTAKSSPLFAGLKRSATNVWSKPSSLEHPKPKVFIDYAPAEFRSIRLAFGLSDETYLASFRATAKERVSGGSSGAFMFFSGDNALIVKSMKEKECRKLVRMVPKYAEYIKTHSKSRIIRFFGCHRIRLYGRNFYFVVMSNVLHSVKHTPTISEKYDVKGSWVDRVAKRPQEGEEVTCSDCNASYAFGLDDDCHMLQDHYHRPDMIYKDLDLKRSLHLAPQVAQSLYLQLEEDCEFLNSMGIMDYSLLVGIHKCRLQEPYHEHEATPSNHMDSLYGHKDSTVSQNLEPIEDAGHGPEEVYFVGIIDILQEWDWAKQLEKAGKVLMGKPSQGISAVDPDTYSRRFKLRVREILQLQEE